MSSPSSWPRSHDGLIHVLAVHAGSLAAVSDAPFDTDWTTPESNAYWDQMTAQVNPIGRVNRRGDRRNRVAKQLESPP